MSQPTEVAKGLRKLADFIDQNADELRSVSPPTIYQNVSDKHELAHLARLLTKHIGEVKKNLGSSWYTVHGFFGGSVEMQVFVGRELICKKVEVGTRPVERKVIPAVPEKPEEVIEAHDEPVFEYECPESLMMLAVERDEIKRQQAELQAEESTDDRSS